jgi:predicted nuclease with TOPRIM domain
MVPNGNYVPKWKLENAQNGMVPKWKYDEAIKLGEEYAQKKPEVYFDIIRQRNDRIRELEEKLDAMTECRDLHVDEKLKLDDKYKKLDEFNESLLDFNKAMNTHEVSVIVNGQKYKVV